MLPVRTSSARFRALRCAALAVALSACGGDDAPAVDAGPPEARWEIVFDDLPGAVRAVWGTSAENLWLVGAANAAVDRPLVMHWDGVEWETLASDANGSLWWVFGFVGGPVYMGGDDGLILVYRDGALSTMPTPSTATIFGLWGPRADEVWAVGAATPSSGGVVWRLDDGAWVVPDGLPAVDLAAAAVWKLTGSADDDIWFVGSGGLGMHWNGDAFAIEPTGVAEALFTVALTGACFVAVGGIDLVTRNCGDGWATEPPAEGAFGLAGVDCEGDECVAVGADGWVMRDRGGGWVQEDLGLGPLQSLHAVWLDPDGGLWATGGDALQESDGVVIHHGVPLRD